MNLKKMLTNFRKQVTVELFLLCMKVKKKYTSVHEVSMTVSVGRIANQRKLPKWLPFKNHMSESCERLKSQIE